VIDIHHNGMFHPEAVRLSGSYTTCVLMCVCPTVITILSRIYVWPILMPVLLFTLRLFVLCNTVLICSRFLEASERARACIIVLEGLRFGPCLRYPSHISARDSDVLCKVKAR